MSFTFQDVQLAYERIRPYVRQTPLEESFYLGGEGRRYFFKLESLQRAKRFKAIPHRKSARYRQV